MPDIVSLFTMFNPGYVKIPTTEYTRPFKIRDSLIFAGIDNIYEKLLSKIGKAGYRVQRQGQ